MRTHILALLRRNHLLSAAQLIQKIKEAGHTVNKTSVYRALEILGEQQLIVRKLLEDEALFELAGHHHDHIVCTNCGTVESIECALTLPQTPKGFTIQDHTITLYGLCPNCQSKR